MIYLDTNVVLSLFVEDSQSENALAWYQSESAQCVLSRWVLAEYFGSVGLRNRKGDIPDVRVGYAQATIESRMEKNFTVLPVTDEAVALAASWLRNPKCALQSGDALHLAIANKGGATALATFDDRFANAAAKLKLHGIRILLLPEKTRGTHRVEQTRSTYRVGKAKTAKRK